MTQASTRLNTIDPLPSLSSKLKWEGPFHFPGWRVKPSLSVEEQVDLLSRRGLVIDDRQQCTGFLRATNYYRFSGYARYFQQAPHQGDDMFVRGVTFAQIRSIYEADEALRATLTVHLGQVELLLRTHVARVIADDHGPYGHFLEKSFYTDASTAEPTVEACLRDIDRSKDRHILRYRADHGKPVGYSELPVWSAVEAWSFGTLSKAIERGATGSLAEAVATSLGIAKSGFAYRVRSLVYLRNRCAHHSRLWHHSVLDAGPTPNNVRSKVKRLAGQFEPRSVLDVIASLDDMAVRGKAADPVIPQLVDHHSRDLRFWEGLVAPQNPRDHQL
ncbi:Abi family protein [Streptomyces sp. NPDC087263]|uniref:Abi family protein n=1 Tax=Streptomyces sp. NPDC087263 TaxID=3365773 RepID=UPI0038274949